MATPMKKERRNEAESHSHSSSSLPIRAVIEGLSLYSLLSTRLCHFGSIVLARYSEMRSFRTFEALFLHFLPDSLDV